MSLSSLSIAQETSEYDKYATENSGQVTKAMAVQYAKQEVSGRVLKIESTRNTYRVKILQHSGRVIMVEVDKHSGRIVSNQHEDK